MACRQRCWLRHPQTQLRVGKVWLAAVGQPFVRELGLRPSCFSAVAGTAVLSPGAADLLLGCWATTVFLGSCTQPWSGSRVAWGGSAMVVWGCSNRRCKPRWALQYSALERQSAAREVLLGGLVQGAWAAVLNPGAAVALLGRWGCSGGLGCSPCWCKFRWALRY